MLLSLVSRAASVPISHTHLLLNSEGRVPPNLLMFCGSMPLQFLETEVSYGIQLEECMLKYRIYIYAFFRENVQSLLQVILIYDIPLCQY